MGISKSELDKIGEWFTSSDLTSATIEYNVDGGYKVSLEKQTAVAQVAHVQPHIVAQSAPAGNAAQASTDVAKQRFGRDYTNYRTSGRNILSFSWA